VLPFDQGLSAELCAGWRVYLEPLFPIETVPELSMTPVVRLLPVVLTALFLVACGGDDDDESPPAPMPTPTPSQPPARGTLLTNPPTKLGTFTPSDLVTKLGGNDLGKRLLDILIQPKCSVDVHQIRYQTVGGQNEPATASGALMLPSGTDAACQGARPIVMYAHGTTTLKTYNIADLNNSDNGEGLLLATVFASQGYIVIAPNYAGFDSSDLSYHPYLNADQQSKDMIDALSASRSALPVSTTPSITDGGKLFITGYSQGGFVAMATHRALQSAGSTVTASAPMSGPYALSAFGDAIFQGQVTISAPLNVTLLMLSYQKAYGNIFSATTDVFESAFATGIDTLLPSTASPSELYAQNKLPEDMLFNSAPPDPAFAAMTPATEPAGMASVFAKGFGTSNLVTNAYRLAYLRDSQTAPDGGFPTATDGLPPANPTNTFRQALKTNDLRTWAPTSPVLLCAGNNDPTVLYINTQLIQNYWTATAPTASVSVLDVDSAKVDNDPFGSLKDKFSAAKDLVRANAVIGGANDGGDEAVFEAYHAGLVPPFCLSAVKSFFDAR
jgi:Prolyl oligopeptidase family